MKRGILAVTGGTGFVGRTLIAQAVEAGFDVRALARKVQAPQLGVMWVAGALDQPQSLGSLMADADAVIHLAGVTTSPSRAGFAAGNIAGTQAVADAAQAAGVRRFVHVSSLSARLPTLSDYGWSKAESERVVAIAPLDWTIVRPPAIFGPGDQDFLNMFKAAQHGFIPIPHDGYLSVIEVSDLARLLLVLVSNPAASGHTFEPDDGRDDWTHAAFARAIGNALGKNVATPHIPQLLMRLGAMIDQRLRRAQARLTVDRVRYFYHRDWRVDPARRPPESLWRSVVETPAGLSATLAAYRAMGLMK